MNLITKAARYVAGADRNPATSGVTEALDLIIHRLHCGRFPSERLQCVEVLLRRVTAADDKVAELLEQADADACDEVSEALRVALSLREELVTKGVPLLGAILEQDRTESELIQSTLALLQLLLCAPTVSLAGSLEDSTQAASSERRSLVRRRSNTSCQSKEAVAPLHRNEDIWRKWSADTASTIRTAVSMMLGAASPPVTASERAGLGLVPCLLDLLADGDYSVRLQVSDLLTHIARHALPPLQKAVLRCPRGVSRMMDLLRDPREVVRTYGLRLVMELSRNSGEIQRILAFENIFELLFEMIDKARYEEVSVHVDEQSDEVQISRRYAPAENGDADDNSETDDTDGFPASGRPQSESLARTSASDESLRQQQHVPMVLASTSDVMDLVTRDCLIFMDILLDGDPAIATLFAEAGCIPKLCPLLFLADHPAKALRPVQVDNLILTIGLVDHLSRAESTNKEPRTRALCLHYGVTESIARLICSARNADAVVVQGLLTLGRLSRDHVATLSFLHGLWVVVAEVDDSSQARTSRAPNGKEVHTLFLAFVLDMMTEHASQELRAAAFCFLSMVWLESESGLCWFTWMLADKRQTCGAVDPASSNPHASEVLKDVESIDERTAHALQRVVSELLGVAVGWPDEADPAAVLYACSLLASWMVRCCAQGSSVADQDPLLMPVSRYRVVLGAGALTGECSAGEPLFMKLLRTLGRAVRENSPPLVRLALLLLLCCWLYVSDRARQKFLSTPLNVPLLMDLVSSSGSRAEGMLFVHIRGLAALAIAECMELECAEAESLVISPRTLVGIVRKRIGLMRFASYLDDVRASAYFAAAITGSPGLLLEQRFARGVLTTEFRQGSGLVEELGHMYIFPQELVSIMEPVYDCVQKRLLHEYVEQEVPPSDTEMQGSTLKSAEVGVSASPRNAKEFATPGSLSIDNRHFDDTTNKSSNEIRAMQMRIRELEDMVAQLDEYKRMIRKQDEALLASKEEVEMLRRSLRESQDYADSLLRGSESRFREELRLVRDQLTEREDLVRRLTEQVASLEQALQSRQRDVESISKACEALALENEQLRNADAHVDDGSSVLPAQHVHSGVFRDPAERTTADHFRSNEAHAYIDETSESSACDITDVRILERALAEERQKNERLMILLNQFEDAERGEDSASELVRIENAHLRERLRALEDYIQSQNRTNTGADGAPSDAVIESAAEDASGSGSASPRYPASEAPPLRSSSEDRFASVLRADASFDPAIDAGAREQRIADLETQLVSLQKMLERSEEDAYETQQILEEQVIRLEQERDTLRTELASLRSAAERVTTHDQHQRPDVASTGTQTDVLAALQPSESELEAASRVSGERAAQVASMVVSGRVPSAQQPPDALIDRWVTGDSLRCEVAPANALAAGTTASGRLSIALDALHNLSNRFDGDLVHVLASLRSMEARVDTLCTRIWRCSAILPAHIPRGSDASVVLSGSAEAKMTPQRTTVGACTAPEVGTCVAPLEALPELFAYALRKNQAIARERAAGYGAFRVEVLILEEILIKGLALGALKDAAVKLFGYLKPGYAEAGPVSHAVGSWQRLEDAFAELRRSETQLAELETQYRNVCDERDRLRSECASLGHAVAAQQAAQTQLAELETQYRNVCDERDRLRSECASLGHAVAAQQAAQTQLAELETQYRNVCDERDSLLEHASRLESVQETCTNLKSELDAHVHEKALLNSRIRSLEEDLAQVSHSFTVLREQHADCDGQTAELQRLEELVQLYQTRIEEYEEALTAATRDRRRLEDLEDSMRTITRRCEELESERRELEISLEQAQADREKLAELEARNRELESKSETRDAELEELSAQVLLLQETLASREDQVQHLQSQVQNLQNALGLEREEALAAEKQYEEISHELQSQLDRVLAEHAETQRAHDECVAELHQTNQRLATAEEQQEALCARIHMIEAEHHRWRRALTDQITGVIDATASEVSACASTVHFWRDKQFAIIDRQLDMLTDQQATLQECELEFDNLQAQIRAVILSAGATGTEQVADSEARRNERSPQPVPAVLAMHGERDPDDNDGDDDHDDDDDHAESAIRADKAFAGEQHTHQVQLVRDAYERQLAELESRHEASMREMMRVHEQVLQELEEEIEHLRTIALASSHKRAFDEASAPETTQYRASPENDSSASYDVDGPAADPASVDALQRSLVKERMASGDLRQENIRLQTCISALRARLAAWEHAQHPNASGTRASVLAGTPNDDDDDNDDQVSSREALTDTNLPRLEPAHPSDDTRGSHSQHMETAAELPSSAAAQRDLIAQLEKQIEELIARESRLASAVEMVHDENMLLRKQLAEQHHHDKRAQPQQPWRATHANELDASGADSSQHAWLPSSAFATASAAVPATGAAVVKAQEQEQDATQVHVDPRAADMEAELWRLREEHNELLICLAEMEMECNAYKERLRKLLQP